MSDLKWLREKLKTVEFYMAKDWNKYKYLIAYRHFLIRDICNIQLKEFDRS
jgi:hypothetical protein